MGKLLNWGMQRFANMIVAILLNKFDCFIIIEGNRGLGKCQKKGDKVLMSNGEWKNVEDIKIGNEVISPQEDGNFTYAKVIETHNRFEEDIYEVREATREKKLLYSCAGNHDIPYFRNSHPRKKENGIYNGKRLSKQVLDLKEAKELSKIQWASDGSHLIGFTTTAIDYGNKDCLIEPYCLGAWLGDGYFSKSCGITFGETKKDIYKEFVRHYGITKSWKGKNRNCTEYRYSILGELAKQLERLGLRYKNSGNKFIPKEAMLSSIKYRFELLAGLIDTDGYVMKNADNHIEYTTKSPQLAEDVKNLVFSLGGYSNIKKVRKKCQTGVYGNYFNVKISFKNPKIIPLKNKFKKERLGNQMKHDSCHIAIRVVKGKPDYVYGFELDKMQTKSQWYVTDNWMITHNSTLAYEIARKVNNIFKKLRREFPDLEGYKFVPEHHILYSKEDVIRFYNKWNGIAIADEMINVAFNRDFWSEGQKDLIKIMNMNRDHQNCLIACVPQFATLDNQIKNLCKIKITIIRRGIALIQTPNRAIYSKDKWDSSINEKIERDWLKEGITKPAYPRLTTSRGIMRFPDLQHDARERYEKIKVEKRNKIIKSDYKNEISEEKIKTPEEICVTLLKTNKIKNATSFQAVAHAHGIAPETLRDRVRKILEKNGDVPEIASYYWERKVQGRRALVRLGKVPDILLEKEGEE